MNYSIVFVCQQGELEIKSVLLATSLKRYLQADYECVAAIPEPAKRWGQVSPLTLTLLKQLGVRFAPITNRIADDYPIGNKVAALGIETTAPMRIFLDSDILCLREFDLDRLLPAFIENPRAILSIKPADLLSSAPDSTVWQQVYTSFSLPMPTWRVITSVSGDLIWPYFNAGVLAVHSDLDFASSWEKTCQILEATPTVSHKRPWLDQLALSVVIAQLNLQPHCLDERFNYPAHLKPLPASLPFLCHYHWPTVIRREPKLNTLVKELVDFHPELNQLFLQFPDWAKLLQPYQLHKWPRRFFARPLVSNRKSSPNQQPTAIITGIPRSGTSYLCRLLHSLRDCVVINEPTQIFAPLTSDQQPWQIPIFYQELRQRILDGQPVENKLHNGQLIEDTAIIDTRTGYTPPVSRPDFLLCTKNTLAYMARLPQLRRVLPHIPIIACVRHPLDTLASWKTTFPHLRHAAVADFPIGHVNDPLLALWQRNWLQAIGETSREADKRALLWCYLAECVLQHAHHLVIIRYEDLVQQPEAVLKAILRQIPHVPTVFATEKIVASKIRQKREVLDQDDLHAVDTLCSHYAAALGYR